MQTETVIECITESEAAKIALEQIDYSIPKTEQSFHWSQRRWLLGQLAQICIEQSISNKESEYKLQDRLEIACDIVDSIWYETAPKYAKDWDYIKDDEPDDEKKDKEKKVGWAKHELWSRRDPQISFKEGLESKHAFHPDRAEINSIIANYLSHEWLRHPTLDWVLLDMTITMEICAFGETIKQKYLSGKKDWLGIHHRYDSANGNIDKMMKIDWSDLAESLWTRFLFAVGMPVGAIWAAFYYEWNNTGLVMGAIYGLIVSGYVLVKLYKGVKGVIQNLLGKENPKLIPFKLYEEMYNVWKSLEGPVISPELVKESMKKSSAKGAVWENSSWVLIDRIFDSEKFALTIWKSQNPLKKDLIS